VLPVFAVLVWLASWAVAQAQVTVTNPSGQVVVRPADEFATRVLQDRWDMNERTDLGAFINGVDQPLPNLNNIAFADGLFTATAATHDPSVFFLDTGIPGEAHVRRSGRRFPIDASVYRRLTYRMCLGGGPGTRVGASQLFWSREDIYTDISSPRPIDAFGGCQVYSIDLQAWSQGGMLAGGPLSQYPWAATIRALRFDPTDGAGQPITLDWVALTSVSDASSFHTVTWTGTGAMEVHLDANDTATDGTLGRLVLNGAATVGMSGGSLTFQAGALPPGDYYVAVRPAGSTGPLSYSSGFYRVAAAPVLAFTSPHPEGSADDFATVQLGNAWDFDSLTDLDAVANVTGAAITTAAAEDISGVPLGTPSLFTAVSTPGTAHTGGFGDPILFLLRWDKRGRNYRIDTSRYRIFTAEFGVAGARDVVRGSAARLVWKRQDEAVENVSAEILLNHRAGATTVSTLTFDMAALPLEPGLGSPSHSGWTGLVHGLRLDPHEFGSPRTFYVRRARLAALERSNTSYALRWTVTGASDAGAALTLYYDDDPQGFNGIPIASGIDPDNAGPSSGAYVWNTSAVADGEYYLYAVIERDGVVVSRAYARWPVVVDHTWQPLPRLVAERSTVRFGALGKGAVRTAPQEVGVSIVGGGTANWSASATAPGCGFFNLAGASGAGNGAFTVSVASGSYPPGSTLRCSVRIEAAGVQNSPQFVDVELKVLASSLAPFGRVDAPVDGVTAVTGALPVTGWALDDLQVGRVEIWRDPVAGESTPHANGLVFIGVADLLPGARPDVEAAYPTYPVSYRAGWGFLLLTNMLPAQGNGTFRLHVYAIDLEQKHTLLGSPRITCTNATAIGPFGTIDTPSQGGTASGSAFVNFGWALTHYPYEIPADGSTIWVFVDGQPLGHPVYDQFRSDIATLFPGYANSGGAVGYFVLNTQGLANGIHSIAWSVTDSGGHSAGIGSRYFRVFNAGSVAMSTGDGSDLGRPSDELARIPTSTAPLQVRRGLHPTTSVIDWPLTAGRQRIAVRQMERLEIGFDGTAPLNAYLVSEGRLGRLPIGASLDDDSRRVSWLVGPGFIGEYRLLLIRQTPTGPQTADLVVDVVPRFGPAPGQGMAARRRDADRPAP
jgi:hypothetical protein